MSRWGAVLIVVGACAGTRVNGAGVMLDMQPPRPATVGAYDFDLLGRVRSDACLSRGSSPHFDDATVYWLIGDPFAHIPAPIRNVVGAAVFQILDEHPAFDTIVATRVIVTAKDAETSCATVYARGVRLKKAAPPPAPAASPAPPSPEPAPPDEDDDDDDRDAQPPAKTTVDPFSKPHG